MFDFRGIYNDTQKYIHKSISTLTKHEMHMLCSAVVMNLKFESATDFDWLNQYIEKAFESVPHEVNKEDLPF